MTTGAYISGAAHFALILFLLFGGIFARDRLPEMTVADVTVLSEAEFAALYPSERPPEVREETAQPPLPQPDAETPETPEPDTAPAVLPPAPAPEPDAPEAVPEPPELEIPDAEVTTEAPVIAPPSLDDGDTIAPEATPAPAPRVAPEPAPIPEPETETAPELREATAPEPQPEAEEVAEPEEAAAPEAATTEIVTEAETPDELAPSRSLRPRTRPERTARAPEPETPRDPVAEAVAAALSEEAAEAPRPAVPTGPPLSFGEQEALRVAVSRCWSVDVGSRSADVTVTVGVTMNPDGTVANNVVRQISAEGGDAAAQQAAFEKARRAILRCQSGGFPLPAEKYGQWQEIEMTFNPEGMRLR